MLGVSHAVQKRRSSGSLHRVIGEVLVLGLLVVYKIPYGSCIFNTTVVLRARQDVVGVCFLQCYTMSYINIVLNIIPTLYEGHIVSVHRMVMENRPVDPGSIQGSHRPISFIRMKHTRYNTRGRYFV